MVLIFCKYHKQSDRILGLNIVKQFNFGVHPITSIDVVLFKVFPTQLLAAIFQRLLLQRKMMIM